MCDYSLHGIENRLAEEGEVLVVHRFSTGSKGLTSPEYHKPSEQPKGLRAALKQLFAAQSKVCAVCIPDGAQLMLSGISPALQQAHDLCTTEAVIFRQLSANGGTYRDAVEFKNGVKVRLQDLEEGQSVEVLALSPETADVREEVYSRRRQTGSSDVQDGSLKIPEEVLNLYSDGGPEVPALTRGFRPLNLSPRREAGDR
jgi:hypothetical protein